eukprot:6563076-Alexandrium_andersonii.AAC.1
MSVLDSEQESALSRVHFGHNSAGTLAYPLADSSFDFPKQVAVLRLRLRSDRRACARRLAGSELVP